MKRRHFLSLFLLAPASALADDGLLFDAPVAESLGTEGMLFDLESIASPVQPAESIEKALPEIAVAEKELPELWYWSHEGCPPCKAFKNDYAKGKEGCGFLAVEQTETKPSWMPDGDPQFWWHVSEKIPTQKDIENTRHIDGYLSWKDLTTRFKLSREPKKLEARKTEKKIQQVGGPAKDPFVQRDRPSIRAVARYHAGHNCPDCGKSQFNIENDAGPSHTHRCNSCRVVWYHADQTFRWGPWATSIKGV